MLDANLWSDEIWCPLQWGGGFPGGSDGQESTCNVGNLGSIPRLGRSPGEGNGSPPQYSCLENPMDRGAWWVTVHEVTKSWTQLSDFHFLTHPQREAVAHLGSVSLNCLKRAKAVVERWCHSWNSCLSWIWKLNKNSPLLVAYHMKRTKILKYVICYCPVQKQKSKICYCPVIDLRRVNPKSLSKE